MAAPREPMAFELFFDVAELDLATPLWVAVRRRVGEARRGPIRGPDYARDVYGKAWDFNRDGDFEGIDGWGNRPEFIRNRLVKDGVMSFDVSEDPYFIWGDMWLNHRKTNRPVAIDLAKYPVLKMRVRQSCATADWQLYGRVDAPALLNYKFPVYGTAWQTIRIDLEAVARSRRVARPAHRPYVAGGQRPRGNRLDSTHQRLLARRAGGNPGPAPGHGRLADDRGRACGGSLRREADGDGSPATRRARPWRASRSAFA